MKVVFKDPFKPHLNHIEELVLQRELRFVSQQEFMFLVVVLKPVFVRIY